MDLTRKDKKFIGAYGEKEAAHYMRHEGFFILAKNVSRKTGEIDLIAKKGSTLHFVEVKTLLRREFPDPDSVRDDYDPSANLHPQKIRKVARTAEWYVMDTLWEGDWQVDGALVWLRERDGAAKVEYFPQIV
jgi:putative endonuclease